MTGCLTPAVEQYIRTAMVSVKRKLINSVQTSCNLTLQELNKTYIKNTLSTKHNFSQNQVAYS